MTRRSTIPATWRYPFRVSPKEQLYRMFLVWRRDGGSFREVGNRLGVLSHLGRGAFDARVASAGSHIRASRRVVR